MKKFFALSLAIIILSSLCACNNLSNNAATQIQTENEFASEQSLLQSAVPLETPPYHRTFEFDSYEELTEALTKKGSDAYAQLREEQDKFGKVYQNTLSKLESGEIKIAVPKIGEDVISSNISLLTNELYNMPWFWYNYSVGEQNISIKTSYLQGVENLQTEAIASYTDVLKLIAPEAPSPENYEKYDSYEKIYEKDIVLNGGITVKAMIANLKSKDKTYVYFYYENMLIVLYSDQAVFTDDFWKTFSLVTP